MFPFPTLSPVTFMPAQTFASSSDATGVVDVSTVTRVIGMKLMPAKMPTWEERKKGIQESSCEFRAASQTFSKI